MYALYRMIRQLITDSPQRLLFAGILWIAMGASCGVIGLTLPNNAYSFFNPCALGLYAIALLFLLVSLSKYLSWRGKALTQVIPDSAILLMLDHILKKEEHYRSTAIHYAAQPVVFTPPPVDTQQVPVLCATCQQEAIFRVDSMERRQKKRLRALLIAVVSLLLVVVLSIVISMFPNTGWTSLAELSTAILIFWCALWFSYPLYRPSAVAMKIPPGHRVRQPGRGDLELLHSQTSFSR